MLNISLSVMAEWFRASISSSGGQVTGVWVRIPIVTLVSVSKMLYYNCFSSPRSINGYSARGEVDIVYEKPQVPYRQLRAVYSPGS